MPLLAAAQSTEPPVVPAPAESASTATLDAVLVTGEQSGPGLWKVTKSTAAGEHVLWILGSYGPLPKKMTWRSKEIEATLAESQELLTSVSVSVDIGFFKRLTLLPSLIGVRNNPGDANLKDVVPPDLYARWVVLKEKYIGRDNGVEKWRPIFAAQKLYDEAIDDAGLATNGIVRPVVIKLAKKKDLPIVTPKIELEIDKPRAVIKGFKKAPLDDLDCFAKTIKRLETDLELMRARANAWATGDVKALREMTHVDQQTACIEAVMNSQIVEEQGYKDMPARLANIWVAAAEAALNKNQSTVAVLSIDEILKPDGYIAKLRAKGYQVEDPLPKVKSIP
jgi:uncharacterized protein YbaP (TraB family)